jgi:MFS family permease
MPSLDASVVNIALPHIGHDFDVGLGMLQWVLTGYLLAFNILLFSPGGALGDRYGRRKVFLISALSTSSPRGRPREI